MLLLLLPELQKAMAISPPQPLTGSIVLQPSRSDASRRQEGSPAQSLLEDTSCQWAPQHEDWWRLLAAECRTIAVSTILAVELPPTTTTTTLTK
mmetsp:Transcript_110196/g.218925  ORF Transcript_110196/g.218925 Transcript_110196/m.218925 type:complete len:94 (-) Transcript_110196:154-435(-)